MLTIYSVDKFQSFISVVLEFFAGKFGRKKSEKEPFGVP
jgi:hypothetical protein